MGRGANPQEAQHVAAAAIQALKDRPDWSLGVAAVNTEHSDLLSLEYTSKLPEDFKPRFIQPGLGDRG